MTEPHEIFTPDAPDRIIHVTPNCHLSTDLANLFSPVVSDVLAQEEAEIFHKPEIHDVVGRQPNWLS